MSDKIRGGRGALALLVAILFALPQLGCGDAPIRERKGAVLPPTSATEAQYEAAKTQMAKFGQAVDNSRLSNSKLPTSLQELTEADGRNPQPFLDAVPKDPWGNEYEYRTLDRTTYEIRSYGEDKFADTDDDLVWPPRE